ncbi:MAG: LLM class flavin-dependent oxidoreductase, partial [Gammaproteobacteria bacterium]
MKLGFWPPVYGNWIISAESETCDASFAYTKKATLLAEQIGFDTLLLAEHFMNPVATESEQLDCWTAAAGLAAVTEKIEIIAAVKPGFRAPGVIAKMAAGIDDISQGRFAINLVSAWWIPEFEMLGVP